MNKTGAIVTALFLVAIPFLAFTPIDLVIIQNLQMLPSDFGWYCLYLSEFGKSEYYLAPLFLLAGYWFYRGRRARMLCKRAKHFRRAAIAAYIFGAIAISGLIVNILKPMVGRARPKQFLQHGDYGFDPFTLASRWHSFPSGHTCTMVAFTIALSMFIPQRWRPLLVAYAAILISARAVVAAHYMSDIMGGALVAVATCYLLQRYVMRKYALPFAGQ
jgi:membrane-associated phospholipid phosphatase